MAVNFNGYGADRNGVPFLSRPKKQENPNKYEDVRIAETARMRKQWNVKRKSTMPRILARDRYQCAYCGAKNIQFTIDHVLPISMGGTNDDDNLVAACQKCNNEKGDKTCVHPHYA